MEELQYLSLVSKVCNELENHLGISDKTLAEFIIDLADQNSEQVSFAKALEDAGAEMEPSFCGSLLRTIQQMRPKKGDGSGSKKGAGGASAGPAMKTATGKAAQFPGLAVQNKKPDTLETRNPDKKDEFYDGPSSWRDGPSSGRRDKSPGRSSGRDRDRDRDDYDRQRSQRSGERDGKGRDGGNYDSKGDSRNPQVNGVYKGTCRCTGLLNSFSHCCCSPESLNLNHLFVSLLTSCVLVLCYRYCEQYYGFRMFCQGR